jgi:hypothetical protein
VHRKDGYRISYPPPVNGLAWKREAVEGAPLSFRQSAFGPDGRPRGTATLTLMRECRTLEPTAPLEARNLRLGLGGTRLRHSGPTAHLGLSGWAQGFEADFDDRTVYVDAVTLIVDRCAFDLILVAPIDSADLAGAFAAWWSGFAPQPFAGEADRDAALPPDPGG